MACSLRKIIAEDTKLGIAPPFDAVQSSISKSAPWDRPTGSICFLRAVLMLSDKHH